VLVWTYPWRRPRLLTAAPNRSLAPSGSGPCLRLPIDVVVDPQHVRNIPDDLMLACARTDGVVNINGVGMFLGAGANGIGDNSTETLLRHIEYAVQLVGPRHVGLGLDYVFDLSELEEHVRQYPEKYLVELRKPGSYVQIEPERFPIIAERLLQKGYSDADVQGIMGHNNLRVARQVWR